MKSGHIDPIFFSTDGETLKLRNPKKYGKKSIASNFE